MGAGEWQAAQWVRPALLCEVAFTEWTEDGRIRHPSFQGLREDKKATEVKQEKPASRLGRQQVESSRQSPVL